MRPNWMAPGRSRISTFITVPDAMRVVRFAEEVFDAKLVRQPLLYSDGTLWNGELAIGDCTILLGSATDAMVRPGFLYVHVPDVDATFARALAAGATAMHEPDLRFYGDRDGGVTDMDGNIWWIATHVEDVTDEEITRRAAAMEARA